MILSQTAEYGLRAVIHLAGRHGADVTSLDELSASLDIPASYLSKTLQALVQAGVLFSVRGRRGGFSLATEPSRLSLADVIDSFEDRRRERKCLLGNAVCSDRTACAAHASWKETAAGVDQLLQVDDGGGSDGRLRAQESVAFTARCQRAHSSSRGAAGMNAS